jgi:hypothetical protein
MEKVILRDFRQVKEVKLPISGLLLEVYPSILIGDIGEMPDKTNTLSYNISVVLKIVKSWNLYASETDEKPLEINEENFKKIPAPDFEFLVKELESFSSSQKKN